MIEFLNDIDTQVFLFFNGANSPFFDGFMKTFTGRFVWVPMYAALVFMMWRACRWPKMLFYLFGVVLAVTITDQVCATFIRPAVERLRPSNLQNALSQMAYIVDGYRGGRYGFPSCHAANSFALAMFMSLLVHRRGFAAFMLGWAVMNSYTRLYLGVHYPGDLLAGTIIGSAVGAGCYFAVRRLFDRATPQSVISERCTTPFVSYTTALLPRIMLPGGNALTLGTTVTASGISAVIAVNAATMVYICIAALAR